MTTNILSSREWEAQHILGNYMLNFLRYCFRKAAEITFIVTKMLALVALD